MKTFLRLRIALWCHKRRVAHHSFNEDSVIRFNFPFAAVFIFLSSLAALSAAEEPFPDGVASGDVTESSAVLWTRVTSEGPVEAQVSSDDQFASVLHLTALASLDADLTVKVDATGLKSGTRYSYRFRRLDNGALSPIGRLKTAPATDQMAALRFIYSGDSNASARPFRVLTFAANEDPDFWFWAGDTIYADGDVEVLSAATNINDYHAKHRQNREDVALRDLLTRVPVWTQWDDHEVANDYDGGDIEPEIGHDRMIAGQQAFFDYMPIRPQGIADDPRRIYRSFRYGSLAEFFILDCRQYRSADLSREGGGPDPRAFFLLLPEPNTIARLQDPSRTMLGKAQLDWLKNGLKYSTARWKFVLSSVTFTSLLILPYDRWDGYEAERYELLRFIDTEGITGVILLSADIHANIHNPDVTYFQRQRLDAQYSPGFRVPEFVAGPIATDTFRQEVRDIGALLFGQSQAEFDGNLFFNAAFGLVAAKVIAENRTSFAEADRYAYLLVDVGPDGVTLTHKGIASDPTIENPVLETLHTAILPEAAPDCGAGLPLPAGLFAAAIGFGVSARRIRRSRPEPALCNPR